jgi:histone acetyltransferase (RNA polymerase elongator complex component)
MPSDARLKKPYIVPVFIPHAGCPHRCVFCNQHGATGQKESLPKADMIRQTIRRFLSLRRDNRRWTEIAFYGGSFLGLPREQIQLLLATAGGFVRRGRADGIRFSTRPDTIDAERLAWIATFPVTAIELGVQSMSDAVLALAGRGHSAESVRRAVALLKTQPYALGVQMMVGLPGDTPAAALATARQLATLGPDFARIYPTLVLKGSRLARWHARGRYTPMPLEAAVALVAELYTVFARHDIPVIRMGLQATTELTPGAELVAGPFHPAFGALVRSALWLDALSRHMEREALHGSDIRIDAHPRLLSQIKGDRDANIMALLERFNLKRIEVRADGGLAVGTVMVNGRTCPPL